MHAPPLTIEVRKPRSYILNLCCTLVKYSISATDEFNLIMILITKHGALGLGLVADVSFLPNGTIKGGYRFSICNVLCCSRIQFSLKGPLTTSKRYVCMIFASIFELYNKVNRQNAYEPMSKPLVVLPSVGRQLYDKTTCSALSLSTNEYVQTRKIPSSFKAHFKALMNSRCNMPLR